MRLALIVFLFAFSNLNLFSQISSGGVPLSFHYKLFKKSKIYNTPAFNYSKLNEEDKAILKTKAYRFGKTHQVSISPENSGVWETLGDGSKVWKLQINSDNAFSIGLFFNTYFLEENVKLFVYSLDKKILKGAYNSRNNKKSEKFSILPIDGDKIIIELNVPSKVEYGRLIISGIIHDYKGSFSTKKDRLKSSGACNVNVNCSDGDEWQNEKRSVVKYIFNSNGSTYSCTGALINNTAEDDSPYLLTANHCISTIEEAQSATFIFNYESETCNGLFGPEDQSIAVAELIATAPNHELDFSLLRLSIDPPIEFNAFYAGWNRKTSTATSTVCIHHPSEDIKKISFDNDATTTDDYGNGFIENSHWKITEWDTGTTEGGSSGSPLFDQDHLIVGDLTGGDASCNYNYNDYYSKFDMSWDYFSDINEQLKVWLDPLGTNPETLVGKNYEPPLQLDSRITFINSPKEVYCKNTVVNPEIIIQNKGIDDLTKLNITYKLNNGAESTMNWVGNLKTSEFETIELSGFTTQAGNNEYKVYCSLPNNSDDMFKVNDTLVSSFIVIEEITDLEIKGDNNICLNLENPKYFIDEIGEYNWDVNNGKIVDGNGTNNIIVRWDQYGDKKVFLEYTNSCEQLINDTLDIAFTEHNIKLEIETQITNANINWSIQDRYGNVVVEGEDESVNQLFMDVFCLNTGCYNLIISSNSAINEYSITNGVNENIILHNNITNSEVSIEFCLSHEDDVSSFNVYPNPSTGLITIEAKYDEFYENTSFSIFNLKGEQVIPENKFNKGSINITDLPSGYYLVKIKNQYGESIKKILKL